MSPYGTILTIKLDQLAYQLRTAELMAKDVADLTKVSDNETKEAQVKLLDFLKECIGKIDTEIDRAIDNIRE